MEYLFTMQMLVVPFKENPVEHAAAQDMITNYPAVRVGAGVGIDPRFMTSSKAAHLGSLFLVPFCSNLSVRGQHLEL